VAGRKGEPRPRGATGGHERHPLHPPQLGDAGRLLELAPVFPALEALDDLEQPLDVHPRGERGVGGGPELASLELRQLREAHLGRRGQALKDGPDPLRPGRREDVGPLEGEVERGVLAEGERPHLRAADLAREAGVRPEQPVEELPEENRVGGLNGREQIHVVELGAEAEDREVDPLDRRERRGELLFVDRGLLRRLHPPFPEHLEIRLEHHAVGIELRHAPELGHERGCSRNAHVPDRVRRQRRGQVLEREGGGRERQKRDGRREKDEDRQTMAAHGDLPNQAGPTRPRPPYSTDWSRPCFTADPEAGPRDPPSHAEARPEGIRNP